MAQSSLSGSLHSLEKEIGVRLFERTTAGVVPTPEGQELFSWRVRPWTVLVKC